MENFENRVVIHAFEKDGEIHPPVYAECGVCFYAKSRITGINFSGTEISFLCSSLKRYVDEHGWCQSFDLDTSKLSDEAEEEYTRLKEAGELNNHEDELTEEEMDKFRIL